METSSLFIAALQSSLLLGLLHGVNPCGHSWLMLAPFVTGEKKGSRVAILTFSFVSGTAVACLILGMTLGSLSTIIPDEASVWIDFATSGFLAVIGIILLIKPQILHSHDHDHSHEHAHDHDGEHTCNHNHQEHQSKYSQILQKMMKSERALPLGLFTIGFVNMIVPCPTATIMYGYALNSSSVLTASVVFGSYALTTAIAVSGVIYLIFTASKFGRSLQNAKVEEYIMRGSGAVIVLFSFYGIFLAFGN